MRSHLWPLAPFLTAAVVLGACGSSPSAPGVPKTTTLSIAGPPDIAGAITVVEVHCFVPSLHGETIQVLGIAAGDRSLTVNATISAGAVKVRVSNVPVTGIIYGDLNERDFAGTGVTAFDPSRGVVLSASLTAEQPNSGAPAGHIGVARSISGGVSCGNQKPGSTSLTVSGSSPLGPVASGLTEARVECLTGQRSISVDVMGLGRVGADPVLIDMFISTGSVIVDLFDSRGNGDSYSNMRPDQTGVVVVSAGAQVTTDVSPQIDPTLSLHVSGSASCGSFEKTP